MKQRILKGWNMQRAVFLLMGAAIIIDSLIEKQSITTILGAYLFAMGLFNFGCASGGCYGGSCMNENEKNKAYPKEVKLEN